ncbi:MAG: DNA polymerase [Gammaproteobacteria bacterium]
MTSTENFTAIWVLDFEFTQPSGGVPVPICMVGHEIRRGQSMRLWLDGAESAGSPVEFTDDTLFVAFFASAEVSCFSVLGWPQPPHVLDLYAEFRAYTNGQVLPAGRGLHGALRYFGITDVDTVEKDSMRELAMRGGPYTLKEQQGLLTYCAHDVEGTVKLFHKMESLFDGPRSLLRGAYMAAVAQIELKGIPIDTELAQRLERNWEQVKGQLIADVDRGYSVYDGTAFSNRKFETYLSTQGIPWPRLASGRLALDDETFKSMAVAYPTLGPLRELRKTLGALRAFSLPVGADGRARCLLSPFSSKTGRNQPSNSKFIFGFPAWLRSLLRPPPGYGLAYIDWAQQEFGIAAALSGDSAMQQAYDSGDPYLEFAKQAGAVPVSATKSTHKAERDQFKACVLAVQYGMGAESLAQRINQPIVQARRLLELHRRTYPTFWAWSDAAQDYAMLHGAIHTTYGWRYHVGADNNPRSLRNFPMQANGAEMLRIACVLCAEAGIAVCAPVHDAILIEAPLALLDDHIDQARALMAQASEHVLAGFRLNTDVDPIRYPDRLADPRGVDLFTRVVGILDDIEGHSDVP